MNDEKNEDPIGELERLTNELNEFTSSDVSPYGDMTSEEFKRVLADKRAELFSKHQEMEQAAENARRQMEAAQQAARAAMMPLKKELARMAEGIWTVGLYLGVNEDVIPLRGGTPAPEGTPISVRQKTLAMDEESIIAAEDGGIDVRDIEKFDQWVLSSPAHLQQVLPEEKGVVAILPSRQQRDYGDPWISANMNEKNRQTWFLIRNGERLYRLLADDFNAGARLIPHSNEFTSYFKKDRWGRDLHPGTPQWAEAEEAANAKQRHYMRVALILQGLIERTNVFSPVPEGLSLLTLEAYERGQVIAVSDDEKLLTSSRPPFKTWLNDKMMQLRPGMRIVGAFNSEAFRYVNLRESDSFYRHSRLSPDTAEHPPSNTVMYVEQNNRKELICRYERTVESVWDDSICNFRAPEKRASVTINRHDTFVIPIDLVTIEEMEDYINARTERVNYLTLVPLLKAAIAAKSEEQEQEAPFRRLIEDTLAATYEVEAQDAATAAYELVDWWKFSNRHHRPLINDDPQLVTKAMRMITKEYESRQKNGSNGNDEDTVVAIRALDPKVMAVLRKRDGSVLALVPNHSEYGCVEDDVFFSQYRYVKGELRLLKEWSTIAPHHIAKTQELWGSERWQNWNKSRSTGALLTGPETQQIIDAAPDHEHIVAIKQYEEYAYDTGRESTEFYAYYYRGETGEDSFYRNNDKGLVINRSKIMFTKKRGVISTRIREMRDELWLSHNPPWGTNEKSTVYLNDDLVAQAERDILPLQQKREKERAVTHRVLHIARLIEQAWNNRTEEEAKQNHIAEYGSSDLWNQWLRSHPLPKFPINDSELIKQVRVYVENNPAPDGETLDATDLYRGEHEEELVGITVKDLSHGK